ncbi:MAG: cytochrome B [Sphingobacteriia bacterium]|nr:cytochrome B [Sphingobacteriia bacterium]NCC39496.1 cytochrome B [Gammaproteobacteria bacterium]
MNERRILVWDLPTRLFHWLLALSILAAFATGLLGGNLMAWHGRIGLFVLGLLAFRLTWGLIGSTYARFGQFIKGPRAVLAYLRGQWQGIGHSPLAALSVVGLLGLVSLQIITGLAANDDIAFRGPLFALVAKSTSDWLTGLHRQLIWLLGALIAAHLAAVLFYRFVRKDDLIKPMISGYRRVTDPRLVAARGGGWLAFAIAILVAIAVVWIGNGGLIPPPPPPPPPGTFPAW